MRALEPEFGGLLVHARDEAVGPVRRDARERAGGGVVRRDQQQVQQIVGRHVIVRVQVRRRRLEDVAARDGHRLAIRSGLPSRKTIAVITFVMLAIERWLCEFSSQSTWFVSGS